MAIPIRLALFYSAFFLVAGVYLPFFPVWLHAQGLAADEIGAIAAAAMLAKTFANPLVGRFADRWAAPRRMMIAMAAAALVSYLLYLFAGAFWQFFAITLLAGATFSSIMPLGENGTLVLSRRHGFDYGRVRLWGSLTFIAAAMGSGVVLAATSEAAVLWMMIAGVGLTLVATLTFPADDGPRERTASSLPRLALHPLFIVFLASATLVQSSHAVYYGFGSLHWRSLGIGDHVIGWLWAEGVLAEIVLFAFSGRVVGAVGPARLLLLAGLAGLVRWPLTALGEGLPVLVAVQLLHALTFGAAHLAAVHFIVRAAPAGMASTGQALYSAIATGLGFAVVMHASGALYAAFGGAAYHVMGALAAVGALGAAVLHRRWDGGTLASRAQPASSRGSIPASPP